MEQRAWKRNSIALDVEIRMWRPDGEVVLKCKTLDVSLAGAELLTYDVTFPRHRVLEVRFTQLRDSSMKQPRILATFLRKTSDGIAIQFRKANNETIKLLQSLILKDKIFNAKINHARYGRVS